jgi:hypothetical protein
MKRILIIVGSVLALLFVLGISKNLIAEIATEKGVEMVTGLKLDIGSFGVGIFNSVMHVRNLKLFNPAGFKDKTMLNMPDIYVAYDLPAIIKGKIHLKDVRIHMKEFVVVKNDKGALNLDSLKVVQSEKKGAKPATEAKKEGGKAPEIQIDNMRLKIEKAVYKDYTAAPYPRVMEFNVNIDEEYKNIDNPYSVVSLIVVKALANTSISSLTNFDIKGLQGTVSDTLATLQKVTPESFQGTVKAAQQAMQNTGDVGEAAKSAVDAAKKIFNGFN